jgi:hypothetical protein
MKKIFTGTVIAVSLLWSGSALGEESGMKLRPLAKCEADLWEAASAVYYLVADSNNLGRHAFATEFKKEVEEFEDRLNVARLRGVVEGDVAVQVAEIEGHWLSFKETGEALVAKALKGERADAMQLAKFWQVTETIDEHLDMLIEEVAYPES